MLFRSAYSVVFTMDAYIRSIWNAAVVLPWNLARAASSEAAREAANAAAYNAAFHAAWTTAWNLVLHAEWNKRPKTPGPNKRNDKVHPATDQVSLLHFFKSSLSEIEHASLLDQIYKAAREKTSVPESNIFMSLNSWNDFRKAHFASLPEDQSLVLKPWLEHLDLIVDGIQYGSLPNPY